MLNASSIDISESEIQEFDKSLLRILLFDRTTRRNIIWGTSDYEEFGPEFNAQLPITVNLITGENKNLIQPRILKEKESQTNRTKDKAEVFTPSWMCNEQNNLIDAAWFGRVNVFNKQQNNTWLPVDRKIEFDDKPRRRWKDYVDEKRLEIACGEAPYLVSRYDTVTGSPISIQARIGLLDRKLRVVSENTSTESDWLKWTIRAFQSIYGFEFQGDNLLLARENLLFSFIDYLNSKFGREPSYIELKTIAEIISWNLWQMDGMTFTVPYRSITEQYCQMSMLDTPEDSTSISCYCRIRDWRAKKTITYASMVNHSKGDALC